MNHLLSIFSIFIFFISFSCVNQVTDEREITSDLVISPAEVRAGDSLKINYNNENIDTIDSWYSIVSGPFSNPYDLNLDSTGNSVIYIPDSAQVIAFNMDMNDESVLKEPSEAVVPIYEGNSEDSVSTRLALLSYLFNNEDDRNYSLNQDSLLQEMDSLIALNPRGHQKYIYGHLRKLRKINQANASEKALEYITIHEEVDDKELMDYQVLSYLYSVSEQSEKKDSVKNYIITNYPSSNTAQEHEFKKFRETKDLQSKIRLKNNYENAVSGDHNYLDRMNGMIAADYRQKGNLDSFVYYIKQIEDPVDRSNQLNSYAWALAEKGEKLDFAAEISGIALKDLDPESFNFNDKPSYYRENRYRDILNYYYQMNADTYAFIQYKLGNLDSAIVYQEKAVGEFNNHDINTRYIRYLMEADKDEKAVNTMSDMFKIFIPSSELKDSFRVAYRTVYPEKNDANQKLEKFYNQMRQKKMEKIKSELISEEAPAFSLVNMQGESVSLTDYKDKIVILDFWATWCGPCLASFPGMQKAVEKYQDDNKVEFLFINTFESTPTRKEDISKLLEKNGYDFHVLIDKKSENLSDYQAAGAYGVKGIPSQFVIGRDGKMRYKSVGSSGNAEEILMDINLVVEALRT